MDEINSCENCKYRFDCSVEAKEEQSNICEGYEFDISSK